MPLADSVPDSVVFVCNACVAASRRRWPLRLVLLSGWWAALWPVCSKGRLSHVCMLQIKHIQRLHIHLPSTRVKSSLHDLQAHTRKQQGRVIAAYIALVLLVNAKRISLSSFVQWHLHWTQDLTFFFICHCFKSCQKPKWDYHSLSETSRRFCTSVTNQYWWVLASPWPPLSIDVAHLKALGTGISPS